jgi:hypothetical protein
MQGSYIHFGWFLVGSLDVPGDQFREFKAPFDMQLVQVTGNAANTTTCIIDIGTAADTDAYLDGVTLTGATGVPTVWDQDDFVNAQYPAIPAGTVVQITIDHDGGGGADVDDLNLDLWFTY